MAKLKVRVLFKGGGVVDFDATDLIYSTSTEDETYGKLVGYEIKLEDTQTSSLYLNIENIDAIICISE